MARPATWNRIAGIWLREFVVAHRQRLEVGGRSGQITEVAPAVSDWDASLGDAC